MSFNASELNEKLKEKVCGKKIVVKLSGKTLEDEALLGKLAGELLEIKRAGAMVLIVHGAGSQINGELKAMGFEPRIVDGIRVTDEKTLEIVKKCVESARAKICAAIKNSECAGVEVDDVKDCVVLAKAKGSGYGLVGEPIGIDSARLSKSLETGLAVISCLGIERGKNGAVLNVNADEAALAIAKSVAADELVFVSDVPGVLRNASDANSVVKEMDEKTAEEMIANGKIAGGMLPKTKSCVQAAETIGAVRVVSGADGIISGLNGRGTVFKKRSTRARCAFLCAPPDAAKPRASATR